MIKRIGFSTAANSSLLIVALVLVYHFLIISSIIPYEATWGGRLESKEQMLQFETISISVNLLLAFIVSVKAGYLRLNLPGRLITGFLWFFAVLFALNTVGNIFSSNFWEIVIFTPVTALLAVLFWRMAVEK